MKIELKLIPIREVVEGYVDSGETGVIGYSGKLNIRPPYQREFIYNDKQRNEVIHTIRHNFPLNVMYWVKNSEDAFEMLDGQQRTLSFCEYVAGKFSLNFQAFHNLTKEERDQILDYNLMIYFCEGNDKEKLDWFKVINISGEKLNAQELRNAIYTGPWLTDAKPKFSKNNCAAYGLASKYLQGSPIRQDYLETAISWISGDKIEDYMSRNQHEPNANELWLYFQSVINWVTSTFINYRKEMKSVNWGNLYNQFREVKFDTKKLELNIAKLMMDEDVTKKSGVYDYLLTGNERNLNIRSFTDSMKREAFERQAGVCPVCKGKFELAEMEADHITPWSNGGKTVSSNCQMLCRGCNRSKSNS